MQCSARPADCNCHLQPVRLPAVVEAGQAVCRLTLLLAEANHKGKDISKRTGRCADMAGRHYSFCSAFAVAVRKGKTSAVSKKMPSTSTADAMQGFCGYFADGQAMPDNSAKQQTIVVLCLVLGLVLLLLPEVGPVLADAVGDGTLLVGEGSAEHAVHGASVAHLQAAAQPALVLLHQQHIHSCEPTFCLPHCVSLSCLTLSLPALLLS